MNSELNQLMGHLMGVQPLEPLPDYSGDIREAWKILEKYKMYEPEVSWSDEQHCWRCIFWKGKQSGIGQAGFSASHAICLAAMDAFG